MSGKDGFEHDHGAALQRLNKKVLGNDRLWQVEAELAG